MPKTCCHHNCAAQAAWVRVYRFETGADQYLCNLHWNTMQLRDPDYATFYVPVEPPRPQPAVERAEALPAFS